MITRAFTTAAYHRARSLGLLEHPLVVVDHPIASKNRGQILELARGSVDEVARRLASGG